MVDSMVDRESFYGGVMASLEHAGIPFLVGGAYAMRYHAGVERDSKDFDLFCKKTDLERVLDACSNNVYQTENTYPNWLAKVRWGNAYVDIIHHGSNGLTEVDDNWFAHAPQGIVLNREALVLPAEEMLVSKSFVQSKDCYHGADVNQLLRVKGQALDWQRVLGLYGDHWQVLLGHLVNFSYAFPGEATNIPQELWQCLMEKQKRALECPTDQRICRGGNLSLLGEYNDTYSKMDYRQG